MCTEPWSLKRPRHAQSARLTFDHETQWQSFCVVWKIFIARHDPAMDWMIFRTGIARPEYDQLRRRAVQIVQRALREPRRKRALGGVQFPEPGGRRTLARKKIKLRLGAPGVKSLIVAK